VDVGKRQQLYNLIGQRQWKNRTAVAASVTALLNIPETAMVFLIPITHTVEGILDPLKSMQHVLGSVSTLLS